MFHFSPAFPTTPKSYQLPHSAGRLYSILKWGFWLLPAVLSAEPVWSAERIYVGYGPLEFTIPVAALEVYAEKGKIEADLAAYAAYLNPQQREQLRGILQTRVPVTPVAVAQFLYSPQGEILLRRVGEVIQTKARQPGFYAIRAALILAAADPQGLTLLNVLRKFPTNGIRINSQRSFEIIENLSILIRQTEMAIAAVAQQSNIEASAEGSLNFEQRQDLRKPGPFKFSKQTLILNDLKRNRVFPADIYLPTVSQGKPTPVVVISHGLGNDRQTFRYLAENLVSYGFAVAVPEHPGSNARQLQALINGLANEVTPPSELINRPLDIKYLLDQLERTFGKSLNLQQVGVIGQSFGGYTALALAGAEINFEKIQQDCQHSNDSLNLSLLLQCRGVDLPPADYQLQDRRIKAAIAINPIGSTLFGSAELSQIQTPIMLVASSDDTIAPALPEQIQPFTWLTTPMKYLVLMKNATHFSTLGASEQDVPIPERVIGPTPALAQEYMKALSVAFFQTYIADQLEYRPYLSAAYAEYLSESPIPLDLVQSLMEDQLRQMSQNSVPQPVPLAQP